MAKLQVCGVAIRAYGEQTYGGGNIFPGARAIGRYAFISTATAKKLLKTLFNHERLPKSGYEVKLCADQYLGHRRSKFDRSMPYEIERRASGSFAGARTRKKRR